MQITLDLAFRCDQDEFAAAVSSGNWLPVILAGQEKTALR